MGRASYTNVFIRGKVNAITTIISPVADFSASVVSGTLPLTVNFTDTSTNNPTSWAWDFTNDGTTDSTSQNPSHTYNTAGTYTVKLTSTNAGGSNTTTKIGFITVTVPAPVTDFSASVVSGTLPLTVNFTDISTNTPSSWAWDFTNDGTTDSTSQNPSHTYNIAGTYTVKLTSTNAGGSNTTTKIGFITVTVPAPVTDFSASVVSGTLPLTVNFTDISTNTPSSWAWDFTNDGTTDSTSQNPSHTYNIAGTYTVKLTSTNAGGSNTTIKPNLVTVTVPAPIADFSASVVSGTAPLTVNFTDTSTNTPASWAWDFTNDGTTDSTSQNPSHTYSTAGTYSVKLISTNAGGSNTTLKPNLVTVTSPVSTSGYSVLFDGTGDYLSVPASTAFQFGAGDFTIECWLYPISHPAVVYLIGQTSSTDHAPVLISLVNGRPGIAASSTGSSWAVSNSTTGAIPLNTWSHIAAVRSGNKWSMYVNGIENVLAASTAVTVYNSTDPLGIGSEATAPINYPYVGYISNLRIVKGTALYTAAFTPSTSPLTAVANTSLLTCQSANIVDNSTNNFAITVNGDAIRANYSPFYPGTTWSGYFDGSGDWLTVPANTAFAFGTGDFTIECWVNKPSAVNSAIIDARGASSGAPWAFYIDANNNPYFFDGIVYTSTVAVANNQWNHIAVVRTSGVLKIFVNGVQGYSSSHTNALNPSATLYIGGQNFGTPVQTVGYISNVRIVKGTAVYTANFTPPTTPLTAIAGTSLLTCQGDTFRDNSSNNFTVTASGNATPVPTSPINLEDGYKSVYFDGTGDYISTNGGSGLTFGTGDFTIEGWVYLTTGENRGIFQIGPSAGGLHGSQSNTIALAVDNTSGSPFILYWAGTFSQANNSQVNQWTHFAVVRFNGTSKLYINGVERASRADSTNYTGSHLAVGGYYNTSYLLKGNVSNFRVIKGTALYTANFTPSTSPLTAVTGTSLLTCQSQGFRDNSTNNLAITRNGDAVVRNANPFNSTYLSSPATYSTYFDGAGDMLTATSLPGPGTGNFTYECWVYPTSASVTYRAIFGIDNYGASTPFRLYQYGTNFQFWYNSSALNRINSNTIQMNQWYHLAATRSGTSLRFFVNGTQVGSTITESSNYPTSTFRIGMDSGSLYPFVGYISNVRVVNGTAVYTSNFTPSTTPLTPVAGTKLLTGQTAFNESLAIENPVTVTASGNAVPRPITPFLINN